MPKDDSRWNPVRARHASVIATICRGIQAAPVMRETPKVGRSDPCSCGSGKKSKKCCAA